MMKTITLDVELKNTTIQTKELVYWLKDHCSNWRNRIDT